MLNVKVLLEDYSGKDSFATLPVVDLKLLDGNGRVIAKSSIEFDAPEEFMCHEVRAPPVPPLYCEMGGKSPLCA